ncbi:hypothetical protein TELCIR_10035 [Teladorsagia circumcincta]|uniref:Uncharacterized protein n=1 Tax=Teladorsagia circumcincta TaxID=45464 RepID=A0A2G9UD76_TELCI|nr:hypothetical protein TELCIR_10035 [Teladorsagia circumcincta]
MIYHKSLVVGCSYNRCPSNSTTPSTNVIACVYSAIPQREGQVYIAKGGGCTDDVDCSEEIGNSICIKEGPYRGLCSQDSATKAPSTTASETTTVTAVPRFKRGLRH